jgi:uncharacterized RDD family membrane protein YckC
VPFPVAGLVPCPNHPEVTDGLESCARCGRNFCPDCLVNLGGALTCATCKVERLSDLRSGSDELDYGSPGARFVAQFVDGLLFTLPAFVIFFSIFSFKDFITPGTPPNPLPTLVFTGFLLFGVVVYEGVMLSVRGQTLGKMLMGLKVVTPQGGTISAGQAWGRALSRSVMSLLYCLGPIDALFIFSARRRTLHDRLARTVVVKWRK